MARRRKQSDFEHLASIAPWWVYLFLAALFFIGLHLYAGSTSMPANPAADLFRNMSIGVARGAEVIVPLLFVLAAGVSALRRRRGDSAREPSEADDSRRHGRVAHSPDRDLYETWKEVSQSPAPAVDTTRWSKDLLSALEWKRFELLCAGYFETLGFKAVTARKGADGGIDIHLYADGSDKPGIVVQCKAWKTYKVGVKEIRELLGVMTASQVTEGIFVTTSEYTSEAKQFATGNNIHLIDGQDLLDKFFATSSEHQTSLLQLATSGDFTTPTCPSCGIKMVQRMASKTGEPFWGCVSFPRCRVTFSTQ